MAKFNLDTKKFTRVVAITERCAGNGEVGEMWTEAKGFDLQTPVVEILQWAEVRCEGRLMLTMDQSSDARTA